MDAVTIFAAIAALSAVALIVSTLVGGSRAGSTHTPVTRDTVPGDPMEQERDPGDREPNRVRLVQMVALGALVIALIVLVILFLF